MLNESILFIMTLIWNKNWSLFFSVFQKFKKSITNIVSPITGFSIGTPQKKTDIFFCSLDISLQRGLPFPREKNESKFLKFTI